MENNKKYSAIILAAGKSARMGVPKFSLKFDSTLTFLEHIVNQYFKFGCDEILVVLNPDGAELLTTLQLNLPKNIKLIVNPHPAWERFYSLKLGVAGLPSIKSVFVSNIDNPFIGIDLLQSLISNSLSADYIYPAFQGRGGHPILLAEKLVSRILDEPKNEIHLREFLRGFSSKAIEVDDNKILVNINTYEQYINLFPQEIKHPVNKS